MIKFKKLDDELHFWAGLIAWFCVFVLANFAFEQWASSIIGFIAASMVGVVKEIYDDRVKETVFDWRDLKWTVIGASIPAAVFIIADIIYYYSKP